MMHDYIDPATALLLGLGLTLLWMRLRARHRRGE
jgi:hypothetical protein